MALAEQLPEKSGVGEGREGETQEGGSCPRFLNVEKRQALAPTCGNYCIARAARNSGAKPAQLSKGLRSMDFTIAAAGFKTGK